MESSQLKTPQRRRLEEKQRLQHFLCEYLIEHEGPLRGQQGAQARQWAKSFLSPQDWDDVAINRCSMGKCGYIGCGSPWSEVNQRTLAHLTLIIDRQDDIDRDVIDSLCSNQCFGDFHAVRSTLTSTACHLRTPPTDLVSFYIRTFGSGHRNKKSLLSEEMVIKEEEEPFVAATHLFTYATTDEEDSSAAKCTDRKGTFQLDSFSPPLVVDLKRQGSQDSFHSARSLGSRKLAGDRRRESRCSSVSGSKRTDHGEEEEETCWSACSSSVDGHTRSARRSRAESNLQLQPSKSILASSSAKSSALDKVKKSISFATNTLMLREKEETTTTTTTASSTSSPVSKLEFFQPDELLNNSSLESDNDDDDTGSLFSNSTPADFSSLEAHVPNLLLLRSHSNFSVSNEIRHAALSAMYIKVTRLISSWTTPETRSFLINDLPPPSSQRSSNKPASEISTAADSGDEDASEAEEDFYDPLLAGQMGVEQLPRQTIWRRALLDHIAAVPLDPCVSAILQDCRLLINTFRLTQTVQSLTREEVHLILGLMILLLCSNDWSCFAVNLSFGAREKRERTVRRRLEAVDELLLWQIMPTLLKTTVPDAIKRWQLVSDIVFDDD